MKKFLVSLTSCLMALSLFACKASAEAPAADPAEALPAAVDAQIVEAQESDELDCVVEANGYKLEVVSVEKGTDAMGTEALVISYRFTNYNSVQASFWMVQDDKVCQGDTKLSSEGMAINAGGAYTAPVCNGQSVVVEVPYPFVNETDPIDITVYICDSNYSRVANASCTAYMN